MSDSAHGGVERPDQKGQTGRHDPILFFDGQCGLCNRFIDFMLWADSRGRFRYAPLQGETAQRLLGLKPGPEDSANEPRSFVFLEKGQHYAQSNAVLLVLRRLGGPWQLLFPLYVFPRPLRDFVYRVVARNRYRWFGKHEACRIPAPQERDRFLP